MRTALAKKLLVKIMEWPLEIVDQESPLLNALAEYRYNEYQQYSPGMRFIGSLVNWLRQFELSERQVAYDFIKTRLIFFSNDQMLHLVGLMYPEKIRPSLIQKVASQHGISKYRVTEITKSDYFRKKLRQSLFIGLSDGAKIDHFRRNSPIDNEQVSITYDISPEKARDMLHELKSSTNTDKFTSIFLIDDFTASGTSYFRFEKEKGYTGKICKFLKSLLHKNSDVQKPVLSDLVDSSEVTIWLLFHIATEEALENIRKRMKEWMDSEGFDFEFNIDALQLIPVHIKSDILNQKELIDLAINYFDNSVNDHHWAKAKNKKPYLGYNECSLPVVLNHNTPNNSLPLLWLPEDKLYKGVFPRVTRHK